jgi:beta-mannanase
MNGVWEADFIGTTQIEQKLWATCFANEVTSLRQAPGEQFLIDWNVNACKGDYPFANFYPGNAYVDIVGLDVYDVACETPYTRVSFKQLSDEQEGLRRFEAFAKSRGKPMSLPEWGLSTIPAGDDPAYIDGIGATVAKGNFSFETYFDAGGSGKNLPLTSKTPKSLIAFRKWFGAKK